MTFESGKTFLAMLCAYRTIQLWAQLILTVLVHIIDLRPVQLIGKQSI